MRSMKTVSVLLAGFLSLTGTAGAQTINVTATVQVPITVTGAQDLNFGNVIQGVPSTIDATAAAAGRFDVTGSPSTGVNMSFALPTNLTSGANNLPIGSWTGNWSTVASPTGTGFTPSGGSTAATTSAGGNLFVFVGATVSPGAAQALGAYAGTVTLTVIY
jgi:hypothetical protein